MNTNALKKRIHDYIDEADEQMLQLINLLIESEQAEISPEQKKIWMNV